MAEGPRRRNPILTGVVLALLLAGAGAGVGAFALSGRDSGAESQKSRYGLTAPKKLTGGYERRGKASPVVAFVIPHGTKPRWMSVKHEMSAEYQDGSSSLSLEGAWGDVHDPGAAVDSAMEGAQKVGIIKVAAPRLFRPKGLSSDVVVKCMEFKMGPLRVLQCAWADTDTVGLVTVMRQAGSTTLEDVVQLTGRVWQATRVTISG
jgi:hypothetical protein